MRRSIAALSVALPLSTAAAADFVLSDYPVATPDTGSTNKFYGIQTYRNAASSTNVSVGQGAVHFSAKLASDGNEGYTANVGLLHPITPDWAETDLTGLTSIEFDYKIDAAITDAFVVSLGSGAYDSAIAKAGTVYENALGGTYLTPTTTWRTAKVLVSDLATPSWWAVPEGYPSLDSVLKRVKNLQFTPKSTYLLAGSQGGKACSGKCVGPSMTSISMDLRNVRLVALGAEQGWTPGGGGWISGLGCEVGTPSLAFDSFTQGKTTNLVGGYWYAYSDYDSTGISTDKAKGSSVATMTVTAGDLANSGYLTLEGKLDKRVGGVWHDYAGWVGVGTQLRASGEVVLGGETALGFLVGLARDGREVKSLKVKAKQIGVPDTATHSVSLPVSGFRNAPRQACLRMSDFVQPSYVLAAQRTPLDPSKVTEFRWEAQIADQRYDQIVKDTFGFVLSDVRLYHATSGIRSRSVPLRAPLVQAVPGGLALQGWQGYAEVSILSPDGRSLGRFQAGPRLQLDLPRGTWILAAEGPRGRTQQAFVVPR